MLLLVFRLLKQMVMTPAQRRQVVMKAANAWDKRTKSLVRTSINNGVHLEVIAAAQFHWRNRDKKLPPNHYYGYIGGVRLLSVKEEIEAMLLGGGLLSGKTSAFLNERSVAPLIRFLSTAMKWSVNEEIRVNSAVEAFFKV